MKEGVKTDNDIVADTTFYSCLVCDLKHKEWLYNFLSNYAFFIGRIVLKEIPKSISNDKDFSSIVHIYEYSYYELIKPYFGRDPKHMQDGEYEAIGLAHYLYTKGTLKYLIIDDSKGRKFVTKNFTHLESKLVGTIGFIRDSCCIDRKISPENAVEMLCFIKEIVLKSNEKRPCNLDKEHCNIYLMPAIDEIRRSFRLE